MNDLDLENVEILYSSSSSIVQKCYDKKLKKYISIKTGRGEYTNPSDIRRLQLENELLNKLTIKGVPKSLGVHRRGNKTVLAYTYFPGKYLGDWSKEAFRLDIFFTIAINIVTIIQEIHRHDIIHKSINPWSILYNDENRSVEIVNFSRSTEMERQNMDITFLTNSEKSIPYISPEQTGRMNRPLDYRSDFYSLGVIFYQMLTGRLPFEAENLMEWVHCHIAKTPPPMNDNDMMIPSIVEDLVYKLLAKNAENRYQSAKGLLHDLKICQKQFDESGVITDFELGTHDISERFQISDKLIGRTKELGVLLEEFSHTVEGKQSFMSITGYSGVGKTALVKELFKPIAKKEGFFTQGKYDQFQKDQLYFGLCEAFSGLAKQLLCENDDILEDWRNNILKALGENIGLLVNLIPEFINIVGDHETPPSLDEDELRTRLVRVYMDLFKVFAKQDHPCILFIDDLQWGDFATLFLLEKLYSGESIPYLFIIVAYRDNEVSGNHPLMFTFNKIKENIDFKELKLDPLSVMDLNHMVSDTLHCSKSQCEKLTEIIYEKTEGNPFFTIEFLKNLRYQKLINFNRNLSRWVWEINRIKALRVADNVVEFMIQRIAKLPRNTQDILQRAACIGNVFDLQMVASVLDVSLQYCLKEIKPAVDLLIVSPKDDLQTLDEMGEVKYSFQHDRIQQASYLLADKNVHGYIHYKIGMDMLRSYNACEQKYTVLLIVNQLNKAVDVLKDDEEYRTVASLNYTAALKSKDSSAYTSAENYLKIGLDILRKGKSISKDELYPFERELLNILYLARENDRLLECAPTVLEKTESPIDKGEILYLCLRTYNLSGRFKDCTECGIEALKILGITIPLSISKDDVIELESKLNRYLQSYSIDDIYSFKRSTLPEQALILKILCNAYIFSSHSSEISEYMIVLGMYLTCTKGINSNSPWIVANYSQYVGISSNKWHDAAEYIDLALRINKDLPNPINEVTIHYRGLNIYFWNRRTFPYKEMLWRIFELAERYGNSNYLCFGALITFHILDDINLEEAVSETKRLLMMVESTKSEYIWPLMKICLNTLKNLQGKTLNRLSLDDEEFSPKMYLDKFKEAEQNGDTYCSVFYSLAQLQLHYYYGEIEDGIQFIREETVMVSGDTVSVYCCFYNFLMIAAAMSDQNAKKLVTKDHKELFKREFNRMSKWSKGCPERFQHKYVIMRAEKARIDGEGWEAGKYYTKALELARKNKFAFEEALIAELTGKFWKSLKQSQTSAFYIKEAMHLYRRYGAHEKVSFLVEKYTYLNEEFSGQKNETVEYGTSEDIDVGTILQGAVTLSEEVVLEKLIDKFLKLIYENSGAQECYLLLNDDTDEAMYVRGHFSVNTHTCTHSKTAWMKNKFLPQSIIKYTVRTMKPVLLERASVAGNFTEDPVIQNFQYKSILSIPIIYHKKNVGVIFAENHDANGVFTEKNLKILHIISAQAAVSIRNAYFYQNMEKLVKERTEQLEQTQKKLLEVAHNSGMAEIAIGVMHNIGNISTSISVSSEAIMKTIKGSKSYLLDKTTNLLSENLDRATEYLKNDKKGKNIIPMLKNVYEMIDSLEKRVADEADKIRIGLTSMGKVVKEHEKYINLTSYEESVDLGETIEEILMSISIDDLVRHLVVKKDQKIPSVKIQKFKFAHVIEQCLLNAQEALSVSQNKKVEIDLKQVDEHYVGINILDNGCGIEKNNLLKIFNHGFTTSKDRSGFGLHNCANAMVEMGGSIVAHSDGLGKGACFSLLLPINGATNP